MSLFLFIIWNDTYVFYFLFYFSIQNAVRICRAFFEMVLRKNNPLLAARLLEFSIMIDQQLWSESHPLRQHKFLSPEILEKLEKKNISVETIRDTSAEDIGYLIVHQKMGATVKRCAEEFPSLDVTFTIQPYEHFKIALPIKIVSACNYGIINLVIM